MRNQSRFVNTGKNAVAALFNKFLTILLTFISRKIFICYIGIHYLGINGLFTNILSLLSLADLGLGTAINISLYKPIADNNEKKICALMNFYKKCYQIIAITIAVIGLMLYPAVPYIVNINVKISHLGLYYLLFLAKTVVSYICVYKSSLIIADQKNYIINNIIAFFSTVRVVIQIISIILLKAYVIYLLIEIIMLLLQNIYISYKVNHYYPYITSIAQLNKGEKKSVFSGISSVFLYKIAYALFTGTDNIIISVILGTVVVGYYSNYCTISGTIDATIALLFSSAVASVGNLIATDGANKGLETFKVMQMLACFMATIVAVCLFYLLQDFMDIWLGSDFLLNKSTVLAIIFNLYLSIIMYPVWSFREGVGMYTKIRFVMLIGAVTNIVFSIILGKLLGLEGIIFSTAIAKILTYFWYEPKVLFKDFLKSKVSHYFIEVFKNVIFTLACLIILFPMVKWNTNRNIAVWIIKANLCIVVVSIGFTIRYYNVNEFRLLKNKISNFKVLKKRGDK